MRQTVHVLLATYNGARYLGEQWDSLEAQRGVDIVLHLADDGSSDDTVSLLKALAASRHGAVREVHWLDLPPRRSAAKSFMLLLATATRNFPEAQWFSFCDQDDIWLPEKLGEALALASTVPTGQPVLYGARTLCVDEKNREGQLSRLFKKRPCFANALVQNVMGGNTMLMNRPAALLVAFGADAELVTHDWFAYQMVSGAGGQVLYDARPHVRYRQHAANEIGSNLGWRAMLLRLRRMFTGDYRAWNELQVAALMQHRDRLTEANRSTLEAFAHARVAPSPWRRLYWLCRSGVFRQPALQHLSLMGASLLGRI